LSLRAALDALRGAKLESQPPVHAANVELMLAEYRERAFSAPGWLFELKYDGFRLLADRHADRTTLILRSGRDATRAFPEIAQALANLPEGDAILDGELVCIGADGKPSFQRLLRRAQLTRPLDVQRAAAKFPATLYAFDLLGLNGLDLRSLALFERKRLLRLLLAEAAASPRLLFADYVEAEGEALFAEVRRIGLEGVVAKRANAPYRGGRSEQWLKIRVEKSGDFAVVGFTLPKNSRAGFGGLDLAVWEGGGLVYVGRVGSGFVQAELEAVRSQLDQGRRLDPPCGGPIPKEKGHVWVEPLLVCEVRYMRWTDEGILRQPVFIRFRDDKAIDECPREGGIPPHARDTVTLPPIVVAGDPGLIVKATNTRKVFWPKDGYTKGDLLDYYGAITPFLLPHLHDRLLVPTCFPEGIAGESFVEPSVTTSVPSWVRTERVWNESNGKHVFQFVCDNAESLLYVVNLGAIPLHVWSSRFSTLQRPDWCVLDLKPGDVPFQRVAELACAIRALCDSIGLSCFAKTSGGKGVHVMVPLGQMCTFSEARSLGELLARVIADEMPEHATLTQAVARRGGRIYLDTAPNGHGKLLLVAYGVRPLPGAPVSTPVSWAELASGIERRQFTMRTVIDRLEQGADPLGGAQQVVPDLQSALVRLGDRLRS
jgi:bifunctional non-homologous end joining protein LigD